MSPTNEQLVALWNACEAWRDKHKPWQPADAWVVCDDNDATPIDLVDSVCGVIGYSPVPESGLRLVIRDAYGNEWDLTLRENLCSGMRFYMAHDGEYVWTPGCGWTPTIYHRWAGIDTSLASPDDAARFATAVEVS